MTPAAVTAWRESLGLNKVEAGAALGKHPRTITNWETGRTAPELGDRLAMAAVALGLTDYDGPHAAPAGAGQGHRRPRSEVRGVPAAPAALGGPRSGR